ncbi:MAG: hypothetical protein K0Q52_197 [Microbacterium sp.]|nr:hypothetical protein [Microbacterium sp.]
MSDRIHKSIALPQGYKAHPATIAAAVAAALTELEDKVKARGLRPVWDTVEISTETDIIENRTLGGETDATHVTTGEVSVLAVDPQEVQA